MNIPCHCRSGTEFSACCGPYLSGAAHAPTAEALMRSRFSAYCEGAVDYLIDTHQGAARTSEERSGLQKTADTTDWTNLIIVKTRKGAAGDKMGIVEFVAAHRSKTLSVMADGGSNETAQVHERSRFVHDGTRWLYVDGDQLPPFLTKLNAPCWCGSGKKTKSCHG